MKKILNKIYIFVLWLVNGYRPVDLILPQEDKKVLCYCGKYLDQYHVICTLRENKVFEDEVSFPVTHWKYLRKPIFFKAKKPKYRSLITPNHYTAIINEITGDCVIY